LFAPEVRGDRLVLAYQGLDAALYQTVVRMHPKPSLVAPWGCHYEVGLSPGESTLLQLMVQPCRGPVREPKVLTLGSRFERRRVRERFVRRATQIGSHNTAFDTALKTCFDDIDALRLSIDGRTIVGAGIPWFAAPFGRDALITSLQLLSIAPDLATETLRTLARYQGERDDDWREEEPGKIMHELRRGEMARAGEIPHSPYFGSVDATPLWLLLLAETHRWLGDRALVDKLLPNAERALRYLDRALDRGGGFLRYQRRHAKGLENQGWKDSREGVSYPDGTIARPPIALVEVQGYVVAALHGMARLYRLVGAGTRAARLERKAAQLVQALRDHFWLEDTGCFALALDGDDRQVPTLTSNPGHLLFCGAVDPERAAGLIDLLLSDGFYTGYGVRTLARGQAVFNPLSYHNGSVWPHDNALIALGASRYGRADAALRIFEGLYDAALHFRKHRLPELFCGLGRSDGDFLVHYPVSCSPQAWASGAFFLILQACLGLSADAERQRLVIVNPQLPSFLQRLDLSGMRIGRGRVSLHFSRHSGRTHVDLIECSGDPPVKVQIEVG
jgi:glycogen debranching enzyme